MHMNTETPNGDLLCVCLKTADEEGEEIDRTFSEHPSQKDWLSNDLHWVFLIKELLLKE